jgi:hypothetical protein
VVRSSCLVFKPLEMTYGGRYLRRNKQERQDAEFVVFSGRDTKAVCLVPRKWLGFTGLAAEAAGVYFLEEASAPQCFSKERRKCAALLFLTSPTWSDLVFLNLARDTSGGCGHLCMIRVLIGECISVVSPRGKRGDWHFGLIVQPDNLHSFGNL